MTNTAENTVRNGYFDFLRGVAICMVVAIHTTPSLGFDGTVIGSLEIIIRQVINAAVPLFLTISGFFLAKKRLETNEQRLGFWKNHISRVYIPCLLWSLPLFITGVCDRGLDGLPYNLFSLLFCGYGVYYFVALIIQFYILLPVLQPFSRRTVWVSAAVSAMSILAVTYLGAERLPLIFYAGPFPVWIIFFVMGGALAYVSRDYGFKIPVVILVVGMVAQYFEAKFLNGLTGGGFGIKLSSFIYSAALILILFSKKLEDSYDPTSRLSILFEKTGLISFGIYLTHCHFIKLLRAFSPYHTWLTDTLITLAASILLVLLLKKILPSTVSRHLGL